MLVVATTAAKIRNLCTDDGGVIKGTKLISRMQAYVYSTETR
jgi:hypothetical protein